MSSRTRPRLIIPTLIVGLSVIGATATSSKAHAKESAEPPENTGVVVKVDLDEGYSIGDVTDNFPVTVDNPVLASRGIYALRPIDPQVAHDEKKTAKLVKDISDSPAVEYAEPNYATRLSDKRYHTWPEGTPVDAGDDARAWLDQPLTRSIKLSDVHDISTGSGTVVAVLDTGVDRTHPALAGRLLPGYDFVDDDDDPTEQLGSLDTNGNGAVDEAHGHGTFVAGVVGLIAPDAQVLPLRVMDSDGVGSVFLFAEALMEAVDQHVDVINVSFGTATKIKSQLVEDVLTYARHEGAVVVAAAGNAGSDDRQYPAGDKAVLSVTSIDEETQLLSSFSSWGDWVDVAAPAGQVLGPVPGGRYVRWAGTSMAAPQVSAQMALIRSRVADLDVKHQLEAITKSSRKLDSKNQVKFGSVDLLASITRDDDKK